VVVRLLPSTFTTEDETNPDPFTESDCAPVPTVIEDGDRLVIAGAGLVTESETLPLVPPPGVGLVTVTG
jgi:hypothetical protein